MIQLSDDEYPCKVTWEVPEYFVIPCSETHMGDQHATEGNGGFWELGS